MNINRRDFVKTGAAIFSTGLLGYTASKSLEIKNILTGYPDFLNMFKTIDCTRSEFPVVFPGITGTTLVFGNHVPDDITDEHTLLIQPYTITKNKIEDIEDELRLDAAHILIAAATDRNMIVYDSNNKDGTFTERLQYFMSAAMRANSGGSASALRKHPLTDIFVRNSKKPKFNSRGCNVHGVPDKIWDSIENYYQNDLKGCYANDSKNLVVGVCTHDDYGELVHPVFTNLKYDANNRKYTKVCSLGIINNERVILGSF